MKKFATVILISFILLSFTACGELNQKNIVGNWDTEVTMKDYLAMSGDDKLDIEGFSEENEKRIEALKFNLRMSYYKDGTCDTYFEQKSIDKFYNDFIEIIIDHLNDGGLLAAYKEYGVNTEEELEDVFKALGVTKQIALENLEKFYKEAIEEGKNELFAGDAENGYYKATEKPEKFSIEENVITIINENDKKELMHLNQIDKNTFEITKMVVDYEEIDFKPTFKRVK